MIHLLHEGSSVRRVCKGRYDEIGAKPAEEEEEQEQQVKPWHNGKSVQNLEQVKPWYTGKPVVHELEEEVGGKTLAYGKIVQH